MLRSLFLGHDEQFISAPPTAGLLADFDARFNVEKSGSTAINGDDVDRWVSKNASPFIAVQSQIAKRPTFVSNVPVSGGGDVAPGIEINGQEHLEIQNSTGTFEFSKATIFIVCSALGDGSFFEKKVNVSGDKEHFMVQSWAPVSTRSLALYLPKNNSYVGVGKQITDGQTVVLCWRVDLPNVIFNAKMNAFDQVNSGPGVPSSLDYANENATIGSKINSTSGALSLHRLLIYDDYLTDGGRDNIMQSLKSIYKLNY